VPAAVAQARARVGPKPIEALFRKTAGVWTKQVADDELWYGLTVLALDGTTLCISDTPENHTYFGRPKSGRNVSGYPQLRLVALNLPRSHLLADMAVGPFNVSEKDLAKQLWGGIPSNSVTIVDRNFLAYGLLHDLQRKDKSRHWLVRAKSNTKWRKLRTLGKGDDLVELKLSPQSRRDDPTLPRTIQARAIRYQKKGFKPQVVLTSLTDEVAYPSQQIVDLYHERWEIELGFDEKKTHMLESKETLRSKKPEGVQQELWGIGIAYNLVRFMMLRAAKGANVSPRRVSFRNSLHMIRGFALSAWYVTPGTLPRMIDELLRDMQMFILPKRKPRSNPRVVKVKMSNYKKKPALPHARGLK